MSKECCRCGFYDTEVSQCTCPSIDMRYACPIESAKPVNQKELEEYARWCDDNEIDADNINCDKCEDADGNPVYVLDKRDIDKQPTAYSVDKVVAELEKLPNREADYYYANSNDVIDREDAIEIVKQGGVSDDVCEWRLCDEESNVYDTSCRNPHILIEGTPKENNYEYCPYCGKKIKVVE